MTVRFETRGSGPGPVRTFPADTPRSTAPTPSTAWTGRTTSARLAARSAPAGDDVARRVSRVASAAISSTRACGGPQPRHHHRPGVDQLAAGPVAGLTRPPGTRVDTATATPSRQCRRTASIDRAARIARAQRLQHDSARAGGHACVHRHRVAARVAPRRCRPAARRRPTARRGTAAPSRRGLKWPSATDPTAAPAKPPRSAVATFCSAQRLPAPCPRSTPARPGPGPVGLAATASASRRLRRSVGVGGVGAALRAGQHHGRRAVVGQLQPQRRLLHGVGAVGDDDAVAPSERRT